MKLKTKIDLKLQSQHFIEQLRLTAIKETPDFKKRPEYETNYPAEIRESIKEKSKAKRVWNKTKYPADKATLNQTIQSPNRLIKNV